MFTFRGGLFFVADCFKGRMGYSILPTGDQRENQVFFFFFLLLLLLFGLWLPPFLCANPGEKNEERRKKKP